MGTATSSFSGTALLMHASAESLGRAPAPVFSDQQGVGTSDPLVRMGTAPLGGAGTLVFSLLKQVFGFTGSGCCC